jgi:2-iminobutanoate/2-iminopropanoate deaminase
MDILSSNDAPTPGGPYSQGMRVGDLLFCSGQVGIDPATGSPVEGVAAQTRQALRNLEAVLRSAGASLENVVKTTCFLTDMSSFPEFNAAYVDVMGDHRPTRSTVGAALAPAYLVEIECIASLA